MIAGLSAMAAQLWALLGYLVPFLAVLTLVVFIHEMGHFLVGRWYGVKVEAFSIGFGKEIWGFNDRRGTRWRLAWIPLGGYVRFAGDADAASAPDGAAILQMTDAERAVTLAGKPVGQRAAIVAAGPIANFILSITIFAVLAFFVGKAEIAPRVERVVPGGAAERAGVQAGDLFVSLNGSPVRSFSDLQRTIQVRALERIPAVIDRNGRSISLDLVPDLREQTSRLGTLRIGMVGIEASRRPEDISHRKSDLIEAVGLGFSESWHVIERSIGYLGKLLAGKESADQLSGPIRIAQVSGEVASSSGLLGLITLVAVLSVSIGMINLFPIPMLDGGHLLFYFAEWVRGRPLGEQAQEWGFRAGIAFVMMMTVFVTWNDLTHLVQLWRK